MQSILLNLHTMIASQLNDPKKRTLLVNLKNFVNGSKIPLILLLSVDNWLIIDFLPKANLFNDFVCKQCTTKSNF